MRRVGRRGVALKWHDPATGKVRFRQFRTAAAAAEEARALGRRPAPGCEHTLAVYAQRWLEQVSPTLRVGTARVYTSVLQSQVLPTLGPLPLSQVTSAHVRDLAAELLTRGLAKKTVQNTLRVLHAVFETAREEDHLIERNPAATTRGRRGLLRRSRAEKRAKVKAFTPEQLRAFLAAAESESRFTLLWQVMALTGARPGEAEALRWDDVDLKGRKLRIDQSWSRAVLEPPKTGEAREVDLCQGLVEALRQHDKATRRVALETGVPRSEWLFPSGGADRPIDQKVVSLAFKRALKRAGLPPHHSPHCLRHTYATTLLIGHAPVYYVSRQLGHSSIQMTVDVYGGWLPAGDPAVVDRLEAAYFGGDVTRNVTQGGSE